MFTPYTCCDYTCTSRLEWEEARTEAAAKPDPVQICFELPSTYTGTVGVSVAVVDQHEPSWIITHASYMEAFNVTKGKKQQGCVSWDGVDENFWPLPPGTYGLKGHMANVTLWDADGQYHPLTLKVTGGIGPSPVNLSASPADQSFWIDGDPVGSSFDAIGINTNFPDSPRHVANLYDGYLENAFNNYLIDLDEPHGASQRLWRWHDSGIGGGLQTATNGFSVWSWTTLSGSKLYRADVGDENIAVWGNCSFSYFFTFPGVLCLEEDAAVLGMEVVPGDTAKLGANATVLWVMIQLAGNTTRLIAYDGYARKAPVLHQILLPPVENATVSAFVIRQNLIQLLYTDGMVRRLALVPSTGLPAAGAAGVPRPGFNLSAVANVPAGGNKQLVFTDITGPITVDHEGNVFVYTEQSGIVVVNASLQLAGIIKTQHASDSGQVKQTAFGVLAMATYVNRNGTSKLILLEAGGAKRFMQLDLTLAGCGNVSSIGQAALPAPSPPQPGSCKPETAPIDEIWNNIKAFGGVGSGWVYDPNTSAIGWGIDGTDVIKFDTNVSNGDWKITKIYSEVTKQFLLDPTETMSPKSARTSANGIAFVVRNGIRYMATTCRENKQIYKYNSSTDKFVPSAGIVLDYFNDTKQKNEQFYRFVWHDGNNDGTWLRKDPLNPNANGPDWSELRPFTFNDILPGWDYFYDAVQDDLSYMGSDSKQGWWQWEVTAWDAYHNPIYAASPTLLLNDPVLFARAHFNATTMKSPCPSCNGLDPTRGGNELATTGGAGCGPRASARFTNSSHTALMTSHGAQGSEFFPGGCFSQDSCPQWKLSYYEKNSSGSFVMKWRLGRAGIAKATGAGQFNNGKPDTRAGTGFQPMTVHPLIGNTIALNDMMRAGVLIYSVEGLYVDTLFTPPGGAPGYRKDFRFGQATVYAAPGEYFAASQAFVDPDTNKVHITWGKTSVEGFEVDGWTGAGVSLETVTFVAGEYVKLSNITGAKTGTNVPVVTLGAKNIGTPLQIAGQYPHLYYRALSLIIMLGLNRLHFIVCRILCACYYGFAGQYPNHPVVSFAVNLGATIE